MLKRALGAGEDVAGEEGAAEAEGPEAGRDRDPELGGAGAVDDGEAPEVGHPDVAEVDAAQAAAVTEVELPEAGAGGDHPAQRGVGEEDGVEVDHLERDDHGVVDGREVEPAHRQAREQRAPHGELHGEHTGAARAPARAPAGARAAVDAEVQVLGLARRRVMDAAVEVRLRELPAMEGEGEAVDAAAPAAVDPRERLRARRRHRHRPRRAAAGREADAHRGRLRPAVRPEATPPRGERAGADGRFERQQAKNLQAQDVGKV